MPDAATPFPDGSRVVHIGLSKTGTTGLQAALFDARDRLATHDVHYVGRRRHSRKAARFAIGEPEAWQVNGDRQWRRICKEMRGSDSRVTFFSSESFGNGAASAVPRIVRQLGGDLRILITLRPLAPLLASAWQQGLKRGEHVPLQTYLETHLPGHDPAGDLLWNRRFSDHVRVWGEAVGGEDRVTLLVPDPADRGSLFHGTEYLLGLPPDTLPPPGRDNASLPYAEAELLRSLNAAYDRAGGDVTVWRTTSSYRGDAPLGAVPSGREAQQVRAPRWAAERANTLTARWIDEVSHTSARVLGDLSHLLVDPEDHPEQVTAPTHVALPSAAAMSRIFALAALRSGDPTTAGVPDDDDDEDPDA